MKHALHAEWTKLRTASGSGLLVAAAVALTVAVSAAVAAGVTYTGGTGQDPAKISLSGIYLGQALTAMPRRSMMLAAKAIVITAPVLAAGLLAVLASVLVGRVMLSGNGFTPAHGYPVLSLSRPSTLRAAGGSILYLALIALLSLAIAVVLRDSATAIGVVLALLYLFPAVAAAVTNVHWYRHLQQIAPMTAGLAIQSTVNVHQLPISPWAGLGVLACWATGAMLVGALILQLRDA